MLWLVVGTAIPLVSGVLVSLTLQLRSRVEDLLATALVTYAQIVVTLLFAGVVVGSLARATLLACNLVATAAIAGGCIVNGRLRDGADEARTRWLPHRRPRDAARRRPQLWAWVVGTASSVTAIYLALVAAVVPVYAFDGLWYHLSAVAAWRGADRIGISALEPILNFFPMNGELSFLWTGVMTGGDGWIDLPQLGFAILGSLAVLALARSIGVSRSGAIVAGGLFFLTPIVLAQATVNYVDLVLPALFLAGFALLVRFVDALHRDPTRLFALPVLAGVGIGLAAGAKTTGLLYGAVAFVVLVGNLLVARRHDRIGWPQVVAVLMAFTVPVVALGSFWYVRSWVEYGNPVEPLTLQVGGSDVLTGLARYADNGVDGLDRQMPAAIRDQSPLLRPFYSWLHDPTHYDYQQRVGGLGRQWLWLELPALLVFAGWCIWRRRAWFANIVLPFIVIFVVTPANWWSRLTIVVVAPGAIALVWCVERVRPRVLAALLQVVVVVVVGTNAWFVLRSLGSRTLDITPSKVFDLVGQPSDERTAAAFAVHDFRWADRTPEGSVVATVPADVPARLYYLLSGPDFRNRVVAIRRSRSEDPAELARRLRAAGADHLFTDEGSPESAAALSDPACFTPVPAGAGSRLYRFTCSDPSSR